MNERISHRSDKLPPIIEKLRQKTLYSEKDFKTPQQILQRSIELSKFRDKDKDAYVREVTTLFSSFGRTGNTSDIDQNELIANLFVLRDNPDKTKYRFSDLVKQEEISLLIDSLLGKNNDFLSWKKDSSIILPGYLILRSLKENHSLWNLKFLINETVRQQTIDLRDGLLDSIHTKKSQQALKKMFKQSLDIDKKVSIKNNFTETSFIRNKDYQNTVDVSERMFNANPKKEEKPDDYEVRKAFYNLGSIFNDVDYEQKAEIIINRVLPNIKDIQTKKNILSSFRTTFFELLKNQSIFGKNIDLALNNTFLRIDDFSKVDEVISQEVFKNFQHDSLKAKGYEDFIKTPGVIQAVEAIRKMYLLTKIKSALPEIKRPFCITADYRSLISIDEVQEKLEKNDIKNLFASDNLKDFIDYGDEELVTHFLFLQIENQINEQEDQFIERKVVKKDDEAMLIIKPDFLIPEKAKSKLRLGNLKIPIKLDAQVDDHDNYFVDVYSGNRLLTKVRVDKIENL